MIAAVLPAQIYMRGDWGPGKKLDNPFLHLSWLLSFKFLPLAIQPCSYGKAPQPAFSPLSPASPNQLLLNPSSHSTCASIKRLNTSMASILHPHTTLVTISFPRVPQSDSSYHVDHALLHCVTAPLLATSREHPYTFIVVLSLVYSFPNNSMHPPS